MACTWTLDYVAPVTQKSISSKDTTGLREQVLGAEGVDLSTTTEQVADFVRPTLPVGPTAPVDTSWTAGEAG